MSRQSSLTATQNNIQDIRSHSQNHSFRVPRKPERQFLKEMALARRVITVLVLANALNVVLSCGGGGGGPPPPCSWKTCRHEWRNDWGPGISTGQCVRQHRNAHHIYQDHSQSGNCPASTPCSPSTQYRTMCKYDSNVLSRRALMLIVNFEESRGSPDKAFALEMILNL